MDRLSGGPRVRDLSLWEMKGSLHSPMSRPWRSPRPTTHEQRHTFHQWERWEQWDDCVCLVGGGVHLTWPFRYPSPDSSKAYFGIFCDDKELWDCTLNFFTPLQTNQPNYNLSILKPYFILLKVERKLECCENFLSPSHFFLFCILVIICFTNSSEQFECRTFVRVLLERLCLASSRSGRYEKNVMSLYVFATSRYTICIGIFLNNLQCYFKPQTLTALHYVHK